jgi:hypothetical protein
VQHAAWRVLKQDDPARQAARDPKSEWTYLAFYYVMGGPSTNAVLKLLLDNWPDVYCYPCLARLLKLTEKDVRDAAMALALRLEFRLILSRCVECGREDESLSLQMAI